MSSTDVAVASGGTGGTGGGWAVAGSTLGIGGIVEGSGFGSDAAACESVAGPAVVDSGWACRVQAPTRLTMSAAPRTRRAARWASDDGGLTRCVMCRCTE
jgi:hypothetical protein